MDNFNNKFANNSYTKFRTDCIFDILSVEKEDLQIDYFDKAIEL
jgi:hypothetical protein